MRVLVTGGAGYIGSHTTLQLIAAGHEPVIADAFVNAKPAVLDRLREIAGREVPAFTVDIRDEVGLSALFAAQDFAAVIHFAGLKSVAESTRDPLAYYRINVTGTVVLLEVMRRYGVRTLVFSSSATVYGSAARSPLTEDLPLSAANPYGRTKIVVEQLLGDLADSDPDWRFAALRYFNPVGAHRSGLIGEDPLGRPANLMPYLAQVAVGRRERLSVYGDDYDTIDGTGVRDFIHVEDLASGHLAALDSLTGTDRPFRAWNLGTGQGTSVLQMLKTFERVAQREIPYAVVGRRPGDVAVSFADPSRANVDLGWTAARTIEDMCADTWRWQNGNPDGLPE